MNPILTVTEQGQTRWVAGEPTPAQSTALARIDPDAVVRQALDQQSATVNAYLRTVGNAASRTVDAPRAAQGYSNDSELRARNARYFVTIGAYIALAGAVAWGIVSLAQLAGAIDGAWHWPAWLAATGALALALTFSTHRLEAYLTPEGVQSTLAAADAYAAERAADSQFLISQAISQAIAWRAESEFADSQARQLATESMYGAMCAESAHIAPRRLTLTPAQDAGMLTYATTMPLGPQPAPPQGDSAPGWLVRPAQPDSGCLALCEAVARIYADCAHRGDDLVIFRLPWAQRGDWSAQQKRQAVAVLSQLDPPLLIAGDGGRWRLNRAAWPQPIALSAIRRRWRTD